MSPVTEVGVSSPAAQAIIEGLQPYHGGDHTLLNTLQTLDNFDKHRYPPVVVPIGVMQSARIGHLSVTSMQGPVLGRVKDGAVVMRFTPTPGSVVDMGLQMGIGVTFADGPPGKGEPVLDVMTAIRDYIRDQVLPPLVSYS